MKTSSMKVPPLQQRDLQRVRYWQGQMLRSGDFRAQLQTEAQLRWWHNRALHNAYGVAIGFETSSPVGKGSSNTVHLGPGVAFDCFGRALILQNAREIPFPDAKVSGASFTLVARYRETAQYPDPRGTSGVSLFCCDQLDRETPDFAWQPTASLRIEDGVPLGRVVLASSGPKRRLLLDDLFVPVTPKPLARPHLENGSTVPGSTAWSLWSMQQSFLGLETIVDTSAAGFTRVPCYFGTLDGLDITQFAVKSESAEPLFTHIQDASPNSFRFRVLIPRIQVLRRELRIIPFFVRWLGCQSVVDGNNCNPGTAQKPCCG